MTGKRILTGILTAAVLAACPSMSALATANAGTEALESAQDGAETAEVQEKTPEELAAEEDARRNAIYETVPDSNNLPGWPEGPKVHAASAIVMDMESGAVLYAKAAEEQHFPASITKLLTTLVALEAGETDDTVTFTEDSVSFLEYDDANIGMIPGEQISLRDALHGVLLASANEVSYAVAESLGTKMGGSYQTFIDRMNDRAAALGCTGSHWVNANGLHDDQHYTTAHDMARIAAAVYQWEAFRSIMGDLSYTIAPTSLQEEPRELWQNHRMLMPDNEYTYEYCRGGKTGYTDQSGTTLVTMADNGQMHLAAVVMADYGVLAYEDTRAMLDYAFAHFTKVSIADKEESGDIESFQSQDAYVVLPEGIGFSQLEYQIVEAEAPTDLRDIPLDPAENWHAVKEEAAEGGPGENPDGENGEDSAVDAPTGDISLEEGGETGTTISRGIFRRSAVASASSGATASKGVFRKSAVASASAASSGISASGEEGNANALSGTQQSNGSTGGSTASGNGGIIRYTYEGQEVGHAAILLSESYFKQQEADVQWKPADSASQKKEENGQEPQRKFRIPLPVIIIAAAGAVLALCVSIGASRIRRKRERKRRSRKNEK